MHLENFEREDGVGNVGVPIFSVFLSKKLAFNHNNNKNRVLCFKKEVEIKNLSKLFEFFCIICPYQLFLS